MIIRKIKMINFRVFRDKTIDFNDKTVVLLSAANGVGKTTVVDAIEWCLTGSIGRLKNAFDTRSTNDVERKMNNGGILKNCDAGKEENVRVFLWLVDDEGEKILCREQASDELDPKESKVTINNDEKAAKEFIQKYVGDSFYNYHFCDIQKSLNVQNKKRKDLKDIFDEFITNYDEQKQIAENLDIFVVDVERYIEDRKKQKVSQDVIKNQKEQLENALRDTKQVPYPEIIFYPNEKIDIVKLSKEELTEQREELSNCGYEIANESLSKIVENETLKNQKSIMQEIVSYLGQNIAAIQRAVKAGLGKNADTITELEDKLKKLENLSLSKDTILRDGESVIALKVEGFTQSDFKADKTIINEKEKSVKKLSNEIELLTNNNKMLQLLSSLSVNKQVVIEYRDTTVRENGSIRCPICGSEAFATMDVEFILKEADNYVRQNGDAVRKKEEEKTSLQAEIDAFYQKIINYTKTVVETERKKLETEISSLKELQNQIQPYFASIRKLQETGKDIKAEELTEKKATELLNDVETALLEENKEQELRDSYQKILTVLGYEFENETVQQTNEKVKNLNTKSIEVSNFSYDMFVSKLNAIDSILANQTLSDLKQKLEEEYNKNKKLDTEIEKLEKLRDKAVQRAEDIRKVVETLSKDEYEKVGPALCKFYNKLIRFNSVNEIRIVQKNEGISLVDENDKNIVNILSNGQISVFMLAHFFAGINARNDREKMKIYFIDDLTACMDDVNMLAFMDLLKYQMSSKATMEQLFFATCDERISKLLKYKLCGRGIALCELEEKDF